jgi:hypothetical protein
LFAQCLNQALTGQHQESWTQAATGSAPSNQVNGAKSAAQAPVKMVENTLSHLDAFKDALARPEQSLRKLAPLVKGLETDSQRLTELAKKLPQDSPVRSLVQETAALAYMEAFKFNRGDYV